MKRPTKLMSIIAAAALSAAMAAPSAMAGNEIVKCVDTAGHVTLTDQPCEAGAATVRLSSDTQQPQQQAQQPQQAQRRFVPSAELRHASWKRPQVVRPAPLSRDVATMKAAYRMMLQQDTRPRLAGLD